MFYGVIVRYRFQVIAYVAVCDILIDEEMQLVIANSTKLHMRSHFFYISLFIVVAFKIANEFCRIAKSSYPFQYAAF